MRREEGEREMGPGSIREGPGERERQRVNLERGRAQERLRVVEK